ncbi:MAG TPA: DUF3592 domain-containing protein [Pyrinomonadaceae bacterium]|nr:DUF3592 domain-containing protein [Pyrinomonadaceae bacterium]
MSNDAGLSVMVTVILSLLVTLPFLALAFVFVGRLVRNSARNRALLATGEPAPALILSAADTGVTVNDSPQVRLRLQVQPAGRPPYEAETTLLVGRLQTGMLAPGMPVQVKFDPADPSRVAVESLGGHEAAPAGTVTHQAHAAALLAQEQAFEQLRRTGEGAPARILNYTDTGIRVGDGASLLRFGLEVLPTGRPAFRAETQCAVSDASRPKFVPGATVQVKYAAHGSPQVAVDYAP